MNKNNKRKNKIDIRDYVPYLINLNNDEIVSFYKSINSYYDEYLRCNNEEDGIQTKILTEIGIEGENKFLDFTYYDITVKSNK